MKRFSVVCAALCFATGSVFAQQSVWNDQLMQAVEQNHIAALRQAYDNGANVNYMRDDTTALMVAVHNRNAQMVLELLRMGAAPNLFNSVGDSAIMLAAEDNSTTVDIVDLLLRWGANISSLNGRGMTPLMLAILNLNRDMVNLLLEKGASVISTSYDRRDALIYAVLAGNEFAVTRLLRWDGINTSQEDIDGKTAFHYAVEQQNTNIVRLFLQDGRFDVNRPGRSLGLPPLLYAIQFKLSYTIIELLIDNSAFEGAWDANGRGVAQYFNKYAGNNTQLRNLLVSKGVDLNVAW